MAGMRIGASDARATTLSRVRTVTLANTLSFIFAGKPARIMSKLLIELNPRWIGSYRTPEHGEGFAFDCPNCGPNHTLAAYFKNPLDGGVATPGSGQWQRTGSNFDEITVEPSMEYPCFHGWVENGIVFQQTESPLVVPVETPQGLKLVALSPNQARNVCHQVLKTVEQLTFKRPATAFPAATRVPGSEPCPS